MVKFPRYKILSQSEEREVAIRAKNGDKSARDLLILSNLPFAIQYSRKFKGYKLEDEDLVSVGLVGLIEAVDRFDVQKGFRFITYAQFWIRNEIEIAAAKARKNPATRIVSKKESDYDYDDEQILSSLCDNSIDSLEEEIVNNEITERVDQAVSKLNETEADIIYRHFGMKNREPQSFSQIAESYGRTKARIHQIEKSALLNLKKNLRDLCV